MYALTPPCFAMAYQVRAGQRLRLRVTTSDPDKVPMFAVDPRVAVASAARTAHGSRCRRLWRHRVPDTIDLGDTGGDPDAGG